MERMSEHHPGHRSVETTVVTDPVCGMSVDPATTAHHVECRVPGSVETLN